MHKIFITTILCLCSTQVFAAYAASYAYGKGTKGTQAQRFSYQLAWGRDVVTPNGRSVGGYYELAATFMKNDGYYGYPTTKKLWDGSGAVVIRLMDQPFYPMYIDLGLGLAYFSQESIATRQMGSHYLFEERLGVGFLFGKKRQFEIGYRATHFSNAYLAKKNNGLNMHFLVIGYWFR